MTKGAEYQKKIREREAHKERLSKLAQEQRDILLRYVVGFNRMIMDLSIEGDDGEVLKFHPAVSKTSCRTVIGDMIETAAIHDFSVEGEDEVNGVCMYQIYEKEEEKFEDDEDDVMKVHFERGDDCKFIYNLLKGNL